jgi:hypothetical protein
VSILISNLDGVQVEPFLQLPNLRTLELMGIRMDSMEMFKDHDKPLKIVFHQYIDGVEMEPIIENDNISIYEGGSSASLIRKEDIIRVEFNSKVEAAILEKIHNTKGPLYKYDVMDITSLELENMNISSLEGFQHLESINILNLKFNPQIDDLTPLTGLMNLRQLFLDANPKISDISPLYTCKNIFNLGVQGKFTTIEGIQALTGLEYLIIGDTPVEDLSPIAELPNLKMLKTTQEYSGEALEIFIKKLIEE